VKVSPKLKPIIPKWLVALAIDVLAKKVVVSKVGVTKGLAGKWLKEILKTDPTSRKRKGKSTRPWRCSPGARRRYDLHVPGKRGEDPHPDIEGPYVMIGTDNIIGHPRTWGCYPRLIGTYVRDKQVLPIEEAIRKCTSLPASRLKLYDRGILKPTFKADIVTFDLATIKDNATFENWTVPPSGIKHVFINGKLTAKDGVHLKVRSGLS